MDALAAKREALPPRPVDTTNAERLIEGSRKERRSVYLDSDLVGAIRKEQCQRGIECEDGRSPSLNKLMCELMYEGLKIAWDRRERRERAQEEEHAKRRRREMLERAKAAEAEAEDEG